MSMTVNEFGWTLIAVIWGYILGSVILLIAVAKGWVDKLFDWLDRL